MASVGQDILRNNGSPMCKIGGIFPLNHLVYKNKAFRGGFTYFKANNKSQLDYIYSNKEGLKFIKKRHVTRE